MSVCISSPTLVDLTKAGPYGASDNFASMHVTQSGFGVHVLTSRPSTRLRHKSFSRPEYAMWPNRLCHTSQGTDSRALKQIRSFIGSESLGDDGEDAGASMKEILYNLLFLLFPLAIIMPFSLRVTL